MTNIFIYNLIKIQKLQKKKNLIKIKNYYYYFIINLISYENRIIKDTIIQKWFNLFILLLYKYINFIY